MFPPDSDGSSLDAHPDEEQEQVPWPKVLGRTCSLEDEEVADQSLMTMFNSAPREAWPLRESILLLVDLLRGLESMDAAGILHRDLTPENVVLIDGRAHIAGLGEACVGHDGDAAFGCDIRGQPPHLEGSALRRAPEMTSCKPTHAAAHVWAAGLLFAEAALGYLPTESFFFHVGNLRELDREEEGRRMLHMTIRESFRISKTPGFGTAPHCVQQLLLGLLAKDPRRRWTVSEALERALAAAAEVGLEVPEPAAVPRLPAG